MVKKNNNNIEKVGKNFIGWVTTFGGIVSLGSFMVLYLNFGSEYVIKVVMSSIFYASFTLTIVLPVYNRIRHKRWL